MCRRQIAISSKWYNQEISRMEHQIVLGGIYVETIDRILVVLLELVCYENFASW